jgi:malonyl-CoA/methylmalonyl-CoA synthetase
MALSNPYREEPGEDDNRVQMRRPGYVGRPLPSVQVRIVNPDTGKELDAPGVSGELQVKGPTVFQQYLNREDATKEAFTEDGYFKTGDIAQYDGGKIQSYRILGRASVDIIKSGGHKLSALEIEREILEHPDVAEVAVLGIPDEIWGERVAMVCRLKSGREALTLESLREWCGDRLSKEKVPSRLLLVEEIPKNAMGKVNKKNLATLFKESS